MSEVISILLRHPRARDAADIRRLVGEIGALEPISCYGYLLLCTHFAATSLVAEQGGRLIGFALAYRPPSQRDSLFVWQIGVGPSARGRGLGGRLLAALIEQPSCRTARFLTATVSPDNERSLGLFRGFARAHGVPCEQGPGFSSALFDAPHPDENLLRIGPLKGSV